MDYFRKSILELKKRVGLTEEAYFQLRELKKIKKRSMAQIACDLINKEFKKYDICNRFPIITPKEFRIRNVIK